MGFIHVYPFNFVMEPGMSGGAAAHNWLLGKRNCLLNGGFLPIYYTISCAQGTILLKDINPV